MDSQRPFLYLALFFLGFLIWQQWTADHTPKSQPAVSTSQSASKTASDAVARDTGADIPSANTPSAAQAPTAGTTSTAAPTVHVVTDVLDVTISTRGGDITTVKLPTYPVSVEQKDIPLVLFSADKPYIAQSGLLHDKTGAGWDKRAPNHYAMFTAEQTNYTLDGKEKVQVVMHWQSEDGVQVDKIFTFHKGEFHVDVDYQVQNASGSNWVGREYMQLRRGKPVSKGSHLGGARSYFGAAYYDGKFHKLPLDKMAENPLKETVTGGWVTMMQHYFLSAWIPSSPESENLLYSKVVNGAKGQEYIIGLRSQAVTIPAGEKGMLHSRLYVGPTLQNKLASLAPGLELTIDYGIFTIFSKPLFWLLSKIHSLVGNWGWSIILLTVLVKGVFYKLSETSYRSMAKMKKVAPKIQALKDRFGDDKQAHQQAMMDLYKKEKINPLGGCLPILIQIPVFIALYWVLIEAVELRQAPWILWIKDLSVRDPLFILPVIMGVSMFIQQKLNPPQPDPMMQKMMMAMPFIFTVFFAFFSSGLVLYWVVNNMLSIAQQWYITRKLEKEGIKH